MKKTSKIIALAASGIIAFGIGITSVYAVLQFEPVQTTLSDLGFAETAYEPPETYSIQTEDSTEMILWNYSYTATFPSSGIYTVIGNTDLSAVEEKLYFYEDSSGNSISIDEYGRFRSYMVNFSEKNYQWISDSLTEENLFDTFEEAATALGLDLENFSDVSFITSDYAENGGSSVFDLYEDADSPCSDSIYVQFDSYGALNSIVVTYSNLESISTEDEMYFTNILDTYLQEKGVTASYTVEPTYRERQGILMANLAVSFSDGEIAWAENYVAGKPIE